MNKHVSIILLVIVAMLSSASVAAQGGYSTTHGAAARNADRTLLRGLYLGQYEGYHCWAGHCADGNIRVALTDDDLTFHGEADLPEATRYCDILSGTLRDGVVHLMIVDSASEGHTMVYKAAVELALVGTDSTALAMATIDSLTYGPTDHCYVWTALSPNGQWVGKVVVVQYPERLQYSALAELYDCKMNRVWEKEYAVGSMEQLCVTDQGELVSLGYEAYDGETHFVYNIIGKERASSFDVVVACYPVRQLRLAGVVGRKAVGVGLFTPEDSREQDNLCGGTLGMAFDIDSAILTGFTMRPFQNEDMNIMLNQKTRTIQTQQILDLVSISGVATTSYGAVLAAGRNWRSNIVEDNGVPYHTHTRMGLHLTAIDTNGNVRWVRNIRRNDIQRDNDDLLNIGFHSYGDTVAVVKTEYPRTPVTYDVSHSTKPLIAGKKSNLALYTIAPNGKVEKWMLDFKKKQALLRSTLRPNGELVLLTCDGRHTSICRARKDK